MGRDTKQYWWGYPMWLVLITSKGPCPWEGAGPLATEVAIFMDTEVDTSWRG